MIWTPKTNPLESHFWSPRCEFAGGYPCCGCVPKCTYCTDAFSRADGTDISAGSPCGWDKVSGSGTQIVDGRLAISDSDAIALCTTKQTEAQAPLGHVVKVLVRSPAALNIARVMVNYVDDDNHHFVEFDFNTTSSTITVGVREAGVDKTLDTQAGTADLTTDVNLPVKVCFSPGLFIAEVIDLRVKSANADIRLPPAGRTRDGTALPRRALRPGPSQA